MAVLLRDLLLGGIHQAVADDVLEDDVLYSDAASDHGEEPADENKCALAEQDAADIFNTPS